MRIILSIFILLMLFASVFSPCIAGDKKPGMTPVLLVNKAKGGFKFRCLEVLGRYDAFPHYECYDKYDSLKPFNLEDKWEALPLKKACFRHGIRDTVKSCVAYQLKKDGEPRYMCLDEKGKKYVSFKEDGEWQLLKEDDPACMEREFGPDVIRDFEFEINGDVLKKGQTK